MEEVVEEEVLKEEVVEEEVQGLTVSSNLVKEDISMTQTASLQHLTSDPTRSNQSGL